MKTRTRFTSSVIGAFGLLAVTTVLNPEAVVSVAKGSDAVVSLRDIPTLVRENNPHLAAARMRIQEARELARHAGLRPNPKLELDVQSNDERFRESSTTFGFTQSFPITSRLRLEREITSLDVGKAEAEIAEVERLYIAEARAAFIDVLAFREQTSLRRQQSDVSSQLADFIEDAAKLGELSSIDAGQARLEAAQLSNEIGQLSANEVAALGRLKPALGLAPTDELNTLETLPEPTLPSSDPDLTRRPEFVLANLEAEAAALDIQLERAERLADLEAGFRFGFNRSEDVPVGLDNSLILGVHVTLPIPLWNSHEGGVEAATARAARKQKEIEAVALHIRHEAETARAEMVEWNEMIGQITDELLPMANEQATAAENAYREGLGDLQAILRAREQQLQLGASRIDALRNFHLARVRYDAAVANP